MKRKKGDIMSHMVDTMAYAGETPWHGLGTKVKENLTPLEMLKEAGLDWTVERKPAYHEDAGKYVMSDDWNLLVRSDNQKVLGPCGKNYLPIQNKQAFTFFDKFVKAGDMTMGTAGSLDEGRQVWGLANIRQGFKLPGGDDVEGHLLISHPHQWGKALTIMFTPIRVVCNNTLTMALGEKGNRFTMPHVQEFSADIQLKAQEALGLAKGQFNEFKETASFLAKKRYKEKDLNNYIIQQFHPTMRLGDNVLLDRDTWNRTSQYIFDLVHKQPGANMSEGSWWSALNAVTYYMDHKAGRERDTSLRSAWFGSRAAKKRTALALAVEYAKAA
tara:strand:+ start:742 stop:1728 length:987 start_codon:yes stop_codon:yes gene_type:complete